MVLNISHLSKAYGEHVLLDEASFSVEKGDIVGLIGANGAGKTTLFNMITGREEADSGVIARSPYTTLGYLEQHVCADSDKTTYEETIRVFKELFSMEQELNRLHKEIDAGHAEYIEQQELLTEQFQNQGGLTFRALTRSVLLGLGFTEDELELPVKSLSGGQKSKIGLAKLLLQKPDLMLLDEPTNHLDISSVDWLENFIAGSHITTLVISHDRYFLDRVCTKIAEIENRTIYLTEGNYTRHMQLKEVRDKTADRAYEKTMAEVHRLEGVIEQQRRWNRERNIRKAESTQKRIDRMTDGLVKPEHENHDFSFLFRPGMESGEEVLAVRDAKMEFPGKTLYHDVNFEIRRGECVFLIGANGIGKTTLIRQIMRRGRGIKFGVGVELGYFDQHQLNLTLSNTIFDEIHDLYPKMSDTEVRSALAVFGFRGEKVFETIETLSGGERAKVALCRLMLRRCNFLILDEPTNHLDIYSMAALEDALKQYEGTMLIISHDRYFINALADKVVRLRPDGSDVTVGNYDAFFAGEQKRRAAAENPEAAVEEKKVGAGGQSYLENKKRRSERTKARTALRRKEQEVSELEEQIDALNTQLNDESIASDFEKISGLSEQLAEINARLDAAMEEWEKLAETVSAFEED